eukprot:COSAG03_NODE_7775_length_874_cov_1.680000_1_plen_237_part_00
MGGGNSRRHRGVTRDAPPRRRRRPAAGSSSELRLRPSAVNMLQPLGVVVLLARAVVPLVAYTSTTGLHVAVPPAHAAACAKRLGHTLESMQAAMITTRTGCDRARLASARSLSATRPSARFTRSSVAPALFTRTAPTRGSRMSRVSARLSSRTDAVARCTSAVARLTAGSTRRPRRLLSSSAARWGAPIYATSTRKHSRFTMAGFRKPPPPRPSPKADGAAQNQTDNLLRQNPNLN